MHVFGSFNYHNNLIIVNMRRKVIFGETFKIVLRTDQRVIWCSGMGAQLLAQSFSKRRHNVQVQTI